MTRPIRQVVGTGLRFKYLSITEDLNRLMVRILVPVPSDTAFTQMGEDVFFSTQEILHHYVKLQDTLYFVQAEGVFDRTSRLGKLWWEAGANIEFITDTYMANQGRISVVSKHRCDPNTLERSTEWLKRLGKQGLCQVYCRTQSESIVEAAKSFVTDREGKIFTNVDTARLVQMTTQELKDNPKASNFLITHPIIQVPDIVSPYEPFAGRITLIRGEDGQVATECNDDIWIVDAWAGYVVNKRVRIKNGVGYFWARALDLEDGDTMALEVRDLAGHVYATTQATVKEPIEGEDK